LTASALAPPARTSSPDKRRRKLSSDLDNIVLKALRKEPARRYASAEQLADDIRRHLQGLPVSAAPDSFSYRAGKFVTRHKFGVLATVVVLLATLTGVATTWREARIAAANARRAQERFNDVRKLANSLMFEIHDSIRDLPGSTPARRLLVTRALEYLDSLNQQSQGDTSLQNELAAAYERVGDVLGYPYAANLGDKEGALQSYRKALAIREALATADPGNLQGQRGLAEIYVRVAQVLESSGDFKAALDNLRRALPIVQKLAAGSKDAFATDLLAGNYYFTAGLLNETGDPKGALESYQRAASIREVALQTEPASVPLRTHLAADYSGIAKLLGQERDFVRAMAMQAKAIAMLREVCQANPNSAGLREYLGEATNRLGLFRNQAGDPAGALATYRESHEIFRGLLAADAKNSLAKSNFAFSENGIGVSLRLLGRDASAIEAFREAATEFEEMSPQTSGNRYLRSGLAQSYSGLGDTYAALAADAKAPAATRREYWRQARAACQKSLAIWEDKIKRGEMESGEHAEPERMARCVARCDARIATSQGGANSPR